IHSMLYIRSAPSYSSRYTLSQKVLIFSVRGGEVLPYVMPCHRTSSPPLLAYTLPPCPSLSPSSCLQESGSLIHPRPVSCRCLRWSSLPPRPPFPFRGPYVPPARGIPLFAGKVA